MSFSYAAKGSEDFTAEVPTEAGTYTVKAIVAETANYCGGEATCEFTIEKAPAPKEIGEGEAPTAILGLVDNDKPQELVTPPEKLPDGYEKILYSIDFGKTWIETVPTGTEPGNYVVMTKYVGDDNHTDFFGDPIPVTIDRKTFTVTFAVNGGSAVAEQKVKDGDKVVKPDDPTKENAVFDGWYADDAFETKFDFASAITADTTLYAKWTPTNIKYVIIIGDNAEWTRGSNNGLLIASNADFAKFVSVIVDGKEIPNTCYKAESGSTHITLTKEYLESLSLGSHSFTIQSSDGSASTHFTIKAASGTTPSTGDDNNVVVWALLLVLSAAGLGAVLTLNKKRSY